MKKLMIPLLLLFGFNLPLYAQNEMSDFIRYRQGATQQDGELQISVTQFADINSNTVTLYGVVHMADERYYQQVQRDLDTFDSVLYEGVGPQPGQKAPRRAPPGSIDIGTLQRLMSGGLGFQFQKEGIDYSRPNLVHADMSMEELQRALGGKSINPLEQYLPRKDGGSSFDLSKVKPLIEQGGEVLSQLAEQIPEIKQVLDRLQDQLKLQMAQQLANSDMSTMLDPKMYQAIVVERNKVVIQTLQRELRQHPNKKNLAIFYGAAHNPDLRQRLVQLGFKETNKRWMSAWRIGQGVPQNSKLAPGQPRENFKRKEPSKSY